ncbi:MAG: sporulation protein YabP [Oscillospiraceae bacterium]|nr:sporulation protein YabP [Oscillospiraceae bacterium]
MAEPKTSIKPHNLIMEDRKNLQITGISDVGNFDDSVVVLFTEVGELSIKGKKLHINNLNLERGEIHLDGEIDSLSYSENQQTSAGFFSKIFK